MTDARPPAPDPKPNPKLDPKFDLWAALAPGDLITAVFPRMAGKARPGLMLHGAPRAGAERFAAIVALPFTTRRTNQGGRIPVDASAGLGAACWALTPMASVLPPGLVRGRVGRAPETLIARAEAAMADWFGPDWRETNPSLRGLSRGLARPRLMHAPKRRR